MVAETLLTGVVVQVPVDVFGVGPDLSAIQAEAERRRLPLTFLGQVDHCSAQLQEYKVRHGDMSLTRATCMSQIRGVHRYHQVLCVGEGQTCVIIC